MPKLIVTDRGGNSHEVEGHVGLSIMEVLRQSGVGDLLALCGGCCSCATCHVYIESDPHGALPEIGEGEAALLEISPHRASNSRLSCQLLMSAAMEDLSLKVAPED